MKWIGVLFLFLYFLLLPLSDGYSQSSDLSVRERMQHELLILKTQLVGCQQSINNLNTIIADLKKTIADYKTLTSDLRMQLDSLNQALQTQQDLYETLSKQADDLKKSLQKLETERTWLTVGLVGAGIITAGAVIWAIAHK